HVRRVTGEVALAGFDRAGERPLEQRERSLRVAAGAVHPATLELETDVRDRVVAGERLRLVENLRAILEVPAQPFDACELRQDLGAACIGRLLIELLPKPILARVEVIEVPQWPQAVCFVGSQSRFSEPNQVTVALVASVPTQ